MVQTPSPASNDRERCFTQRHGSSRVHHNAPARRLRGCCRCGAAVVGPRNVSSPSLFVDAPDVVSSADGRTIASWRWTGAPVAPDAPTGIRLAVREPGAPEFGPEIIGPDFVTRSSHTASTVSSGSTRASARAGESRCARGSGTRRGSSASRAPFPPTPTQAPRPRWPVRTVRWSRGSPSLPAAGASCAPR